MDGLLVARVRSFMDAEMPDQVGAGAVLAVSGGADSAAMAALLCRHGLIDRESSVIAHFDHRLRGPAAARADAAAVMALARRHSLPVVAASWDDPVPGEAAARRARYAFLASVARKSSVGVVITGHTSDDQAETVLMRLERGAGAYGLRGMLPDAPLPIPGDGLRVRRPMLCLRRDETRAYCRAHAIAFVDDPTNENRAFARNRLRLDLLPRLERADPEVRRTLLTLATSSRRLAERLDLVAARAVLARHPGVVEVDRALLAASAPVEQFAALRLALIELLGHAQGFERKHYQLLAETAGRHAGGTLHLPRRVVATVDRETLLLTQGSPMAPSIEPELEASLPFSGTVGAWEITITPGGSLNLPRAAVLRARRPGDRLRLRGLDRTKKLQDEFVDRGVPRRLRDAVPLIAMDREVLWSPVSAVAPWQGEGAAWTVEARRRDT